MATGSEVGLCVEVYEKLTAEGVAARVVSMPSWELFEHQDDDVPRLGVAARRDAAGRGRAGLDPRLGALYRDCAARSSA